MKLLKLYTGMALTVLFVTLVSSAVLYLLLSTFTSLGIVPIILIVAILYVIQWIIAPYVIETIYGVEPLNEPAYMYLKDYVNEISRKSGIKTPAVMIANIDIPNAFAYGNPFTGYKIAVTRGLLRSLPREEVKAVLAHEIGHIKHKDVVIMMAVGLIPAIIFWLGEYLVRWGWIFGYYRDRREESLSPYAIVGLGILLLIIGFILSLGVLCLSRLREYYADAHSATVIPGGARLLQRALARIMISTGHLRKLGYNLGKFGQLKMLFISPPEHAITTRYHDIDLVIESIKRQRIGLLADLFSTHPHPAKRLKFLDSFIRQKT